MLKPATSILSRKPPPRESTCWSKTREMSATTPRQQWRSNKVSQSHAIKRNSWLKGENSWHKVHLPTQAKVDGDRDNDKDTAPSSDPTALRARLKHRPLAEPTPANATYDRVLDTARQLAELERLRAQDAAYIRLLEQGRATLARDAHAGARERAAASATAAPAAAHEGQQQQQ